VGSGRGGGSSIAGVEMPGSFVPTVTAITTSQDLQWMVQPTLISSQAPGQSGTSTMTHPVPLVDPYDMPGPSYSTGSSASFPPSGADPPQGPASGPVRSSRVRSRRVRDESVSEDGDVGVLVSVCACVRFSFYCLGCLTLAQHTRLCHYIYICFQIIRLCVT